MLIISCSKIVTLCFDSRHYSDFISIGESFYAYKKPWNQDLVLLTNSMDTELFY